MSTIRCEFSESICGYLCHIRDQDLPSKVNAELLRGEHKSENYSNKDVLWLRIENSKVMKLPTGFGEIFVNLQFLTVLNSKLEIISKDDLKQFPHLISLNLRGNQLVSIPGDLFEFHKYMKEVWLNYNKIKFIGKELLDGLLYLQYLNLSKNENIDMIFDIKDMRKEFDGFGLQKIKYEIEKNCQIEFSEVENRDVEIPRIEPQHPTAPELNDELQDEKLKEINEVEDKQPQDEEIDQEPEVNYAEEQPETSNNLQIEPQTSKLPQPKIIRKLHEDLDKFLTLDEFKDFTIKVKSANFKVHKLIFAARSETFAEMIKNNPDADELVLEDIPVNIFEVILNFVYTDEPPKDSKTAREIFFAAGKLKIESLKEISSEILIQEMEIRKDLEFLLENFNLGEKFDCEKLKSAAFEEVQKHFPGCSLKPEIMELWGSGFNYGKACGLKTKDLTSD